MAHKLKAGSLLELGVREVEMKDIMLLTKMEPDPESDPEESNGNIAEVFTVHVKEEVVECLKEEAAWEDSAASEAAALASLYAGHEVKDELVLGPEGLQPRDVAFTLYAHANCEPELLKVKVEQSLGYETNEETTSEARSLNRHPPPEPCVAVPSSQKDADTATSAPREPEPSATHINQRHIYHTLHYICYICKKQYTQSKALKRHMRTHTKENTYICDTCNESFMKKKAYNTHMRNIHGLKPFGNCKKELKSKSLKKQLIYITTYSCDKCGIIFTERITFLRHQRTHREFACGVCKIQFSQIEHLRSHELIHKDLKPFSCYICKEQFMTSEELLTHSEDHTVPAEHGRTGPTYKCTYKTCDKEFTLSSALILHKQCHTEGNLYHYVAKPKNRTRKISHICDICKKGFRDPWGLQAHKRVHTGERPFSCNICDKAFRMPYQLRRHRRTHTDDKPYLCDKCGKRFYHRRSLVVHNDEKRKERCKHIMS